VDEVDAHDNVSRRLDEAEARREGGRILPEVEKSGDGVVCVTLMVPEEPLVAEAAALAMVRQMGLRDPEVISRRLLHPAEGSVFEVKGVLRHAVERDTLAPPTRAATLSDEEIEAWVRGRELHVVAATVGEDEHSVGVREILDIKHGGIERYGFHCHNLGTSVPLTRVLDAARETGAVAALVSTVITHKDVHRENMKRLAEMAVERGARDRLLLIAGGTQVTDDLAKSCGMDAGFGRGTTGRDVASFIVRSLRAAEEG
jgi:D-ornithine 4,5-aminomutase subunit beta